MIEIDRSQLLRTLDQRHDELARQLDELNERIEQALAGSGAARLAEAPPASQQTMARS